MSERDERGAAGAVCRMCGACMPQRLANGLCGGCLVALALEEELETSGTAGRRTLAQPGYRLLTVLAGDEGRTTYLVEEEGTRTLRTMEVVRATAVAGLTPILFDARVGQLRALRHPAIALVLGGRMTADGDYCVVTEYVPGRVLAACPPNITTGDEVVRLFEPLCEAVMHAHQRGVVHGQLQPASVVLLTYRGGVVPKITGYGVCPRPATETDDIAGLGKVLDALAWAPDVVPLFASFIARATSPNAERFASAVELLDAVRGCAGS